MKIIIDLHITYDDSPGKGFVHSIVRREYTTDLVPMIGMEIEDPAWKDTRKIQGVVISPREGYYYVGVGFEKGENEEDCEQLTQMYHSHGWTSPGI